MNQQYRNPYSFPPISALQTMSARDLGIMLLPTLVQIQRPRVLGELARGLADDYGPRDSGAEALFCEGFGYLERIGYLTEAVSESGPWRQVMVTRAGRAAVAEGSLPGAHAARALDVADLLHPTIASEALPEVDRGPDHFSTAVFKAFRAVEIAVRDGGNFSDDKVGVKLMGLAFGTSGVLRDPDAEEGEAEAMRSLFAGAVGAFKNPVSHRSVDERNPEQAMRLLSFASLLLAIVDERVSARAGASR